MTKKGKSKLKCYVASPYGFAEGTKYWYDRVLLPMLAEYVDVIDPWVYSVDHIFAAKPEARLALWLEMGNYHYDTIAKEAGLLVAVLDQEPPDNGTVTELVWAAASGIPVIAYRNDLRGAGEGELPFNVMIAAAVNRSGGRIVSDLTELESAVTDIIKAG